MKMLPEFVARSRPGRLPIPYVNAANQPFADAEIRASGRALQLAAKRLIDIFGSLAALVVLFPLFLAVSIAIRIDSRGPVFFVQERWGRFGSRIKVLKFRSMYIDRCDISGVRQTVEGDPRVTRVGAFIRKTNLDELPQLINVLAGDMSLVGPRCHAVGMLAGGKYYEELVPRYHERHTMRPGITGLAQVNGYRGPTTDPIAARTRIALDIRYVRQFSIWLDLKIIFLTIWRESRSGSGF